MSRAHEVTIDGNTFMARHGEVLLDAALRNGVDLPFECRAGHCGTCCVRLVAGEVQGGEGVQPGIVHACQCRIAGDVVIEKRGGVKTRTVEGELAALRALSRDVTEVEIRLSTPLPHHPGQYAQVGFKGFPDRPFSISQPLFVNPVGTSLFFHVRRMKTGRVTHALGTRIRPGHPVSVTGPFGAAYFRAGGESRLVLVGTSTGFAPIWSIAVAALRENPARMMMVIAGGRSIESLYMMPALLRIARFPNAHVVPVCSASHVVSPQLRLGRPTDFLPRLLPSDEVFACGAPGMVDAVKAITAHFGATCYADPFLPATDKSTDPGLLANATEWLADAALRKDGPASKSKARRQPQPSSGYGLIGSSSAVHFRSQRA